MRDLARDGARDIQVRTLAIDITKEILQKDYHREACSLLTYVREQVRYVRDIRNIEVLQTPRITLTIKAGDCDDKSICLAAMLHSIGHRTRFICISQIPDHYSHVWVQTMVYGKWVDLEPTEALPCGKRVPHDDAARYITCEL